ncbi:archaeosortase/exosortase family protein [Candidatus Bathyarchaeota archaeon]|nr:archaeosortase/exosortase family protein [Candidatus Bathyarchaeota archaeon]
MRLKVLLRGKLRSADLFLAAFLIPLFTLLLIDSNHFILGWNEGAGAGFLFAFIFLTLEWYDVRRQAWPNMTGKRLIGVAVLAAIITTYFVAVYEFGQSSLVAQAGAQFGYVSTPQILSWTRMLDYTLYAIYIIVTVTLSLGISMIKNFPTPIVFLFGMAFILLLDATFPYGSMQSLQILMQPILAVVVLMLTTSGVKVELIGYESIAVWGQKGFLFINMYWQCAGILSMTIYLLVILVLMVKLQTSARRKLAYAAVGAAGTFFVNIVRIFLIIYYGAFIDVNLHMFHESIGEVLFTLWIVAYLLAVTAVEARAARPFKPLTPIELTSKGLEPI